MPPVFMGLIADLHRTFVDVDPRPNPSVVATKLGVSEESFTQAIASLAQPFELGMAADTRMRYILLRLKRHEWLGRIPELVQAEENETVTRSRAFHGASLVLPALQRQGLLVGLCSNGNPHSLAIARHHNLLVGTATFSFQVRSRKPQEPIYQTALRVTGLRAKHTLYAGDGADRELEGAAKAGFTTIRVDNPGLEPVESAKADYVVRGIAKLPALVESLL